MRDKYLYSYSIEILGAPCKHQGVVVVKYHFLTLNFILSLTPSNCIIYAYIALDK